jgi:DNA invertase Pin-like site-specific DNA recombinase
MRAVAYLTGLDRASAGPEKQRESIALWAERHAVEVVGWELDADVTSTTPIAERPGLLAAYASIRERGAGLLVAANAEAFTRDELVSWLIERAALEEGARVATADGSSLPRPAPAVGYTRQALDLAAAYARVMHRHRIRTALAARRAQGLRIGNVTYGFQLAADGTHLETNDAEQAVIALVKSLAAEGLSQRAIASALELRGIRGRTGAPLGKTQVATILRGASARTGR